MDMQQPVDQWGVIAKWYIYILDWCVVLRVCRIESTLQLIGGSCFHCSLLCVIALVFLLFCQDVCISTMHNEQLFEQN
jgi:hypothetical protein